MSENELYRFTPTEKERETYSRGAEEVLLVRDEGELVLYCRYGEQWLQHYFYGWIIERLLWERAMLCAQLEKEKPGASNQGK